VVRVGQQISAECVGTVRHHHPALVVDDRQLRSAATPSAEQSALETGDRHVSADHNDFSRAGAVDQRNNGGGHARSQTV
jgi:hypothetical protein